MAKLEDIVLTEQLVSCGTYTVIPGLSNLDKVEWVTTRGSGGAVA